MFEDLPHTHHVGVSDLANNAEVPQAAGDRTPRDAVGRVYARDDHPLQRRTQFFEMCLAYGYLNLWACSLKRPARPRLRATAPSQRMSWLPGTTA